MGPCVIMPVKCCGHTVFAHGDKRCGDCSMEKKRCPGYGGVAATQLSVAAMKRLAATEGE